VDTAEETSQELGIDSGIDAESDGESTEDLEVDESVAVDHGDSDPGEDDPEGIEDVEKDAMVSNGDEHSAGRTVAIRRALEERNECRRMAEDLDYLDFDD
jgi:hypothetical protein